MIQDVTPDLAEALALATADGAVVTQVEAGSAAEEAGIRPGDVIVAVDGKPVAGSAALSVGRILGVFELLSDAENGATLAELAVGTGAPKTSLVGLLAGLTDAGGLVRDDAGRYQLGPRFVALALRVAAGRELVTLARPVLTALVAATGETAVLGALATDADVVTYLDKEESANPIRYAVTVGERRDLYCTAAGKALLAYFEPDRLKRYLKATPRPRFTASTVTAEREIRAELARIRNDGLACTSDERIVGASGIAAPIFAGSGRLAGCLLIAGPTDRMAANRATNEAAVRQAAADLTRCCGGTAPGTERKA